MRILPTLLAMVAMAAAMCFATVTPTLAFAGPSLNDDGFTISTPADFPLFDSMMLTPDAGLGVTVPDLDSPMLVAVDKTISALCRPGAPAVYSRAGGYCEHLAVNKSMATGISGPFVCPAGTIADPPTSRNCVDIEDDPPLIDIDI